MSWKREMGRRRARSLRYRIRSAKLNEEDMVRALLGLRLMINIAWELRRTGPFCGYCCKNIGGTKFGGGCARISVEFAVMRWI